MTNFFQIEKCIKNSPFPQNLSFSKNKMKKINHTFSARTVGTGGSGFGENSNL